MKNNLIKMIVAIVVSIAAYIGIIVLVNNIQMPTIDFTQSKIYSLSDESREKLSNLELNGETKIYVIGFTESTVPTIDQIKSFASQMNSISDKFKFEYITDVGPYSDLQSKYGVTSSSVVIIMETNDSNKVIEQSDMYSYDYSRNTSVDMTEQALVNGIIDVNRKDKPKIFFVATHELYTNGFDMLKSYIVNNGCEVNTIELSEDEINTETDLLVLTMPKEDYTNYEADKVKAYIRNGGNILVLGDIVSEEAIDFPNWESILDMYHTKIKHGLVVETDQAKAVDGSTPYYIIPVLNENSEISKDIIDSVGFFSTSIIEVNKEDYEKLATTSNTAYLKTNLSETLEKTENDIDLNEALIGAKITENFDDKSSSAIIFANGLFVSNLNLTIIAPDSGQETYVYPFYSFLGNRALIVNAISNLVGRNDTVKIRKDTGSIAVMNYADEDSMTVVRIIIYSVPIIIIAAGAIVFILRRKKL